MPPPLPERYRLEVRLGRDADVEEWLATDTSLERPVLIRVLGPDSPTRRRSQFIESLRAAAGASHTHLAAVYGAEEIPDGAFAVCEWTGGATLADRIRAGATLAPTEFLANAAGLAEALDALHDAGAVHGAIDPAAIAYSSAHAAKLGAFGRPAVARTAAEDVRDLAAAVESGLTGRPPGGPAPSEIVDGISPGVDRILADARQGYLTAHALAEELRAAPTPERAEPEPATFSRRLLILAVSLVLLAAGLVVAAALLSSGSGGPILVPDGGGAPVVPNPPSTVSTVVARPSEPSAIIEVARVASFDPFGESGENDDLLPALVDGDLGTRWETESYPAPLPTVKPGVGIAFETAASPRVMDILRIDAGVGFSLRWSERGLPADPDEWAEIVAGQTAGGTLTLRLPDRRGGTWLLWLTDLPPREDGSWGAGIAEVRFRA